MLESQTDILKRTLLADEKNNLPARLLKLEWEDLSFTINTGKKIISNSSGYISSGELVALIGSSGAGKTTLLNILAGKIKGNITGDIMLNDRPCTSGAIAKQSAFLRQEDYFYATMTPREVLMFTLDIASTESY